ncbi:hypothetical protein SORBI_3005G161500 [Sorghum bicolor]|uniref:Obtusifoliol 14-alpha demethylase n=1 Tax=Sorghum bicolor TaxID=4558 RepID=A0A1B6PSV9_SORBI|nr:hypothetical protein SORBI_3005G161500 [Sorghum bicolor]
MDMVNSDAVAFSIALVFIAAVITKVAWGRKTGDLAPSCNNALPRSPAVITGITSAILLLRMLRSKGLRATLEEQYTKFGSVFTISFFGMKITFLVGPEVSAHFYQGLQSEISHGKILEFTVPMFGKGVTNAVDSATRTEQIRFYVDALRPSKVRCHVAPMLQEVEEYFAKWGQQGTVDLKQELVQLLILISARCLLGKEVREKMFDEVFSAFDELTDNGLQLTSLLFPYAPTPTAQRRDRAHARIASIFTEIVRSRKSSNRVEEDVLQNLMDAKYKDGRPTTETEVTGLIISILFAAKHTSTTASTWIGARLLRHTECLDAALEEQQDIVKKHGDNIHYNTLLEMSFLHNCIKEALRMHPPIPISLRKVHKNFTVQTREGYEYEIPRGHTIASPLLINHNIPHIYKDPDVYDPHRFSHGREEDRVGGKFTYNSFGGGRHACPGEAYAYMQVKVIWSYLLRNFELKLVSSFPETDWLMIAPEPRGKVEVSYKRRMVPRNVLEN